MSASCSAQSEERHCSQRVLISVSVKGFKIKKVKLKNSWEMFPVEVVVEF